MPSGAKLLFLTTEDWYFAAHRLKLARAAIAEGHDVWVATRVDRHARAIADAGVNLLALEWRRGSLDPLQLRREVAAIRAVIADIEPDIVHCVSLRTIVAACMALRGMDRRRVVLAFTGLGLLFVGSEAWKRLARAAVGRLIGETAARHDVLLLFENHDDCDTIRALVRRDDLATQVNPGSGIDAERFMPLPEPDNAVPVFAFAGRVLKIKGIGELVQASRMLDARGYDHEVILAGPLDPGSRAGIGEAELNAMIADSPVRWIGEVADVRDVWARADVAVAPSHGGEGVPLSLVEAAACARPLIATDVPGCRDIVRDGDTGLLCPPRDAAALCEAMAILLRNADQRARMGARASALARGEFSADTVNARTLAGYAALLAGARG